MKRLLLLSVLTLFMHAASRAYDFSAVNDDGVTIYYDITNSSERICRVTYNNGYNSYSGNVVIPETATRSSNGITYSVTQIGHSAFRSCYGLTQVTIPNSVSYISSDAFYECSGLTEVDFNAIACTSAGSSSSLNAFNGCSNISTFNFGNNVTIIPDYLCYNLTDLTEITIPDSVKTIGSYAFHGCIGLTGNLTIPNSVTKIGDYAFYRCTELTSATIGNGVTTIGNAAFRGCTGLKSVTIPNSVTEIDSHVFDGCMGLTSVTIPNSVTSIGSYAFSSCTDLVEITIPESVTMIGDCAFENCSGLTKVTIPNSVTEIGNGAFSGCLGLTEANFNAIACTSAGSSSYSVGAFNGCTNLVTVNFGDNVTIIPAYLCYNLTELTQITIPNSVTKIGYGAFNGCTGLTEVTIPESVTSIGNDAFQECTGLAEVNFNATACTFAGTKSVSYCAFSGCDNISTFNFGANVTIIPAYLCYNLTELTHITIPNNVTSIGDWAFAYCSGLTEITIPNNVTEIGENAFGYCTGLTKVNLEDGEKTLTMVTGSSYTPFTSCSIETLYLGRNLSFSSSSSSPFKHRTRLTSLTIGNSVTEICSYTFYGCTGLQYVTFGNSVETIGDYAFYGCTGLTQVTIPESVTSIGASFSGCKGLLGIYVNNSTPPSITSTTFSGVDKDACILYVPVGSSGLYRSDKYWGEFYNITHFDFTGIDDVSNNEMIIKSEDGAILVRGENVPVSVYDTGGRLLYHKDDCKNERIVLPSGKIYIVKVGEQVRKVIIK